MTQPDPLEFVTWDDPTSSDSDPDARFTPDVPADRPTTWNGKPIPDNALWEDDGVTPKLTPTGRIRRSRGGQKNTPRAQGTKPAAMTPAARDQLAADLLDPIAKVAMGLSFSAPTVGAVLIERGEKTANAFVALAANSPRMLSALQRASKVGPAADLLQTGVMIFVALQLDTGAMRPESPLAHITGVGALHLHVNPGAQRREGPTTQTPDAAPYTGTESPFMGDVPPFTMKDEPTDPLDPEHSQYSFRAPGPPVSASAVTPLRGGPFGGNFPPE